VEEDYNFLTSVLQRLVGRYVPLKPHQSDPPWKVKPPRALIRQRQEAWHHYKAVRRAYGRNDARAGYALNAFQILNGDYRNYAVTSRARYEEELIYKADSRKLFHAYIRNKKIGRPKVGPLRLPDGQLVSDQQTMCNVFAASFSSVFVAAHPVDPGPFQEFEGQLSRVRFTRDSVQAVLSALDATSAMGPDGLHPRLLKECSKALSLPLSLIFTKSFRSGRIPSLWSVSNVIPIFKARSHCEPLNYRPVSLTSSCCKTMERIITTQLMDYLEANGILSPEQYGFRRGRSTEDQLLLTYDDISLWYDEGFVVDNLLLDFSKAFDVVHHATLLLMLQAIGVVGSLLEWIEAFLSNRVMRVCTGGAVSNELAVVSGVPQGSVLGPVLFLVYINHVCQGLLCSYKAFADDYKLYLRFPRKDSKLAISGVMALQQGLDKIDEVSRSWNLKLNPDKCVVMRFGRGRLESNILIPPARYYLQGTLLNCVHSHKDLGVVVDSSLRFHDHARATAQKAGGLASNLLKSTVCRSPEFMVSLFIAHIRPLTMAAVFGTVDILEIAACLNQYNVDGRSKFLAYRIGLTVIG